MSIGIGGVAQSADPCDNILVCLRKLLEVFPADHRSHGGALHRERRLIGKAAVRQLHIHHDGFLAAGDNSGHILLQRIYSQFLCADLLQDRSLRLLPQEVHILRVLLRVLLRLRLLFTEKRKLQMHLAILIVHQMVLAVQKRAAGQQKQHKNNNQDFFPDRRPAVIAVISLCCHAAPPCFPVKAE